MLRLCSTLLALAFIGDAILCSAQSNGVPENILGRVFYIKNGNTTGTGFMIDYKGKEYVITARHVVEGVAAHNPKLQISRQAQWRDIDGDLIFPDNKYVDIAVLDIHQKAPADSKLEITQESPTIGGQVYFLGFPHGLHTLHRNGEYLPLVKVGVFSGLDNSGPGEIVYYIDGFNNPGFSGGPIVYIDNSTHKWRICAVVQGYKSESIKTKVKGNDVDTGLLVNSGILLAYPIDYALKAIDLNDSK